MKNLDEGDRLRRLSAIMRFVSQMSATASEQELVQGVVQAAAVWYDLDVRAYRRDLRDQYVLEMWLPGARLEDDPRELDLTGLLVPDGATHVSSIQELEQLGWPTLQGEVLLVPVSGADTSRWVIAVPGPLEREAETTLVLVCRSAGAAMDQLAVRRGREVQERLVRRMTEGPPLFVARARALLQEYLAIVNAAAGRVSVQPVGGKPLVLVSQGKPWPEGATSTFAAGSSTLGPDRLAFAFGLGTDATMAVELLSFTDAPFTPEQAQTARAGAGVLGTWVTGVWIGAAGQLAGREATPPFESTMEGELEKAKRLRLNGGVLVASVPGMGEIPDAHALSVVIQTVRDELRSSDLLGQLAGGDIAAVLVRTSPEGVATAAGRVRQRLDALARERQVPPVVVGHALYAPGAMEPPGALVAKARREAGLLYS